MTNQPANTQPPADEKGQGKPEGVQSTIRKLSLKIAGYLYTLGDITGVIAAVLKGSKAKDEAIGVGIWLAGGVGAAVFGNEKPERKLRRLRREISQFLQRQGVDVPEDSPFSGKSIAKESKFYDHVLDFCYRNPSQILNGSFVIGSVSMIKNGVQKYKEKGDIGLLGRGLAVGAGALSGLLIPEYTTPPTEKPQGIFAKAWHWVREKPLRVPALFYWGNNVALLQQIFEDKKEHQGKSWAGKSWMVSVVMLCIYLVANLLLMITPKGETNKKTPLDISSIEKGLGEVVALQPQEGQQELLHQLAGFMANKPEVGRKAEVIAQGIGAYIPPVAGATPVEQQAETQVAESMSGKAAKVVNIAAKKSPPPAAWQEKLAADPALDTGRVL